VEYFLTASGIFVVIVARINVLYHKSDKNKKHVHPTKEWTALK